MTRLKKNPATRCHTETAGVEDGETEPDAARCFEATPDAPCMVPATNMPAEVDFFCFRYM